MANCCIDIRFLPELQVKAVYVKNLPRDVTQNQLNDLFEHHGKITRVVLPPAKPGQENSRYGFVHFAERSSAMKALKNTERYEIDGRIYYTVAFFHHNANDSCLFSYCILFFWGGYSTGHVIECSLAKPQQDLKSSGGSNSQKAAILPSYPPHMGYGLVGSPYGGASSYPGSSLSQVNNLYAR